ncbi:FAD-dependent monooxygenase [Aquimarina sediminis]|uniref:FAD-dependent monooxygenase n=1 Tax=Aquimarina sediminis TaxID=2070536 RepID=UPI000CA03DA2|nr:FAD-dependent monooxygenase [Aquimarina sediminis]
MKNILIVGGGIAGLTIAKLLHDQGHNIKLIEKQPKWQISGTGLYLPSNGVVALDKLGLGNIAREKGFIISSRHIMNAKSEMILDLDLEKIWGREKPCLGIKRNTLHEILFNQISNLDILPNTTINSLNTNTDFVNVELSNGAKEKYDLVIGADGLHSKTRKLILGDISIRKVTAQVCRFMIKKPKNINAWSLYISSAGQFLIIPTDNNWAYCYVNRKAKGFKTFSKNEYMDPFKKFASPIPEILTNWSPDNAYWNDLEELDNIPVMGNGRVVLIGDAAHAMPPFMAQGGALALEDALVLANSLKNYEWSTIASSFSKNRINRIDWTRIRNQKREKLSKLPYWIAKLGLKAVGEKNWTEDYKPLSKTPDW